MTELQAPKLTFHEPTDLELLAAVGRVSILHARLDFVLKRTVKTLADLSPSEADKALAYDGSGAIRDLVRRLAMRRFGKGSPTTLKVKAILTDCERVTLKRNKIVHALWSESVFGGDERALLSHHGQEPMPTAQDVNALADEIRLLSSRINEERMQGFIAEAVLQNTGLATVASMRKDE